MERHLIVFDMDGVLVDVTESYRECIVQTVRQLTGVTVTRQRIQEYKEMGGWNNDWQLSQQLCRDHGHEFEYAFIIESFNSLFFGPSGKGVDGLMSRERWLLRAGWLEALATRHDLAIFTGRLEEEARMTLRNNHVDALFPVVMGDDRVAHSKPHPDGLLQLAKLYPDHKLVYLGDTVDDARAGKAAGVPFLGIITGHSPEAAQREVFTAEGAKAALRSVEELEEWIA
jgi:HAD superfamily phosphatase